MSRGHRTTAGRVADQACRGGSSSSFGCHRHQLDLPTQKTKYQPIRTRVKNFPVNDFVWGAASANEIRVQDISLEAQPDRPGSGARAKSGPGGPFFALASAGKEGD
jgi:hypothetical protein